MPEKIAVPTLNTADLQAMLQLSDHSWACVEDEVKRYQQWIYEHANPMFWHAQISQEAYATYGVDSSSQGCVILGALSLSSQLTCHKQTLSDSEAILFDHVVNGYFHRIMDAVRQWCEDAYGVSLSSPRDFPLNPEGIQAMKAAVHTLGADAIHISDKGQLTPQKSMVFTLHHTEAGDAGACDRCDDSECVYRKNDCVTLRVAQPKGTNKHAVKRHTTLLEALVDRGYVVPSPCGGKGTCNACGVTVVEEDRETRVLACRHRLTEDTLVRDVSTLEIMELGLPTQTRPFQGITRQDDGHAFRLDGAQIAATPTQSQPLVLGIDCGTTTVRLHAWDMDGTSLGGISFLNPQARVGADVLSRIAYAKEDEGLARLHDLLTNELNAKVLALLQRLGRNPHDVVLTTLCGNTVMQHIVHRFPIAQMGTSPYTPHTYDAQVVKASSLALRWGGSVYTMPIFAPFVGGDVVAGLLALNNPQDTTLYVDLGTNGELALLHQGQIVVTSTAAGPALEGGHISCGIGAIPGAVTDVISTEDGYRLVHEGHVPLGLSGSGIIALVARLLESGMIDESGRLHLEEGKETFNLTSTLYLTPKDVREIQLAKAAIRGGIYALLDHANLGLEDVDQVIISGAFGHHTNLDDMVRLGLIDASLAVKTRVLPNAPMLGMHALMCEREPRQRLEAIVQRTEALTLTRNKTFMDVYVASMHFNVEPKVR